MKNTTWFQRNLLAIYGGAGGLKCDAVGCHWRDDTILEKNYRKHVNQNCPDCGANILTEWDYKMVRRMHIVVIVVNVAAFIPLCVLRLLGVKPKLREFGVYARGNDTLTFVDDKGNAETIIKRHN